MNGISASGGGDAPEDIMGGLNVAFSSLSWRAGGSRVSIVFNNLACVNNDNTKDATSEIH